MNNKHAPGRGLIRQGDLLLVPVEELPRSLRDSDRGRLVLAEGEATGHAHVVDDERATLHRGWWETYLQVEGSQPVLLLHEEHDPLAVAPGLYEVRRQREYEPSRGRSWRAVRD
jgi:hypothetical protein